MEELWPFLTHKQVTTATHTESLPKHSTSSPNANQRLVQNADPSHSKPSSTSLTPTLATAWTHLLLQQSRLAQSMKERCSQTEEQKPSHIQRPDTTATPMAYTVRNTPHRTTQPRSNKRCQILSFKLEAGDHRFFMYKTRRSEFKMSHKMDK